MNRCRFGHKFARHGETLKSTAAFATSAFSGITIHARWCWRCESYILPPLTQQAMVAVLKAGTASLAAASREGREPTQQ